MCTAEVKMKCLSSIWLQHLTVKARLVLSWASWDKRREGTRSTVQREHDIPFAKRRLKLPLYQAILEIWSLLQTCLVYALSLEIYTFEAQTTHLCLHYTNYKWLHFGYTIATSAIWSSFLMWSFFLTWPLCSKGLWARLWYVCIKSYNSSAGFGANIGSERIWNSLQLGENVWAKEASVRNFFRRRLSVGLQRLCCCN